MLLLCLALPLPAAAEDITAPTVPEAGAQWMPENTDSFGDGLWELAKNVLSALHPDLQEAARVSLSALAATLLVSLVKTAGDPASHMSDLAGCVTLAGVLLAGTNSLIRLGTETVQSLSEYGKLLLPVMTAAMAAQGGITTSAALYTGTAVFDALLGSLISRVLRPLVYLYLALSVANAAQGEPMLKGMADAVKSFAGWCLKTLLTVFTTYMSVTGVVSGTTDAATLKAAKVTISTAVPVVGGILSDASEAVLVSGAVMKNAAGIYGILAVLAIFLSPFLRIAVHYWMLKLTAALCGMFGSRNMAALVGDFSTAMGLLLAMTGAVCLLLLISTVCFLKGVG